MVGSMNTISAVSGADAAQASVTTSMLKNSGPAEQAQSPFADLMTDAVGQVNQLEAQAQTAVAGLMTGTGVDVHTAMIAAEKANMAFELTLAVHNKAVQAYQSVMGMQF